MHSINNLQEQLSLYRKLILARYAEVGIQNEYFNDEMKTPVHLGIGAEAIGVGVTHCLGDKAKVFGTYRNHNIFLGLSEDTDTLFGELYGKTTGCADGKAGSMHLSHPDHGLILTSAVVATTIPVAVGAALATKMDGSKTPVTVFFGDGATEEGAFWESLNFASLHKLNVVFVCEDNDLAIHTFKKDRQGFKSLKDVAQCFDIAFAEGDGRNILDVVDKTRSMLESQSKIGGPVLLKFDYYRNLQHVGPLTDYEDGYRPAPSNMKDNDPVSIFESILKENGVPGSEIAAIQIEVQKKVADSIERAKKAEFTTLDALTRNVYTEEL